MHGNAGPPNLHNTLVSMDRGYVAPTLFDFIMASGADILGTIKRSPMFPFTYDQTLGNGDTRQLIPKNGLKTIFSKKILLCNKKLTGIAYRDGEGGVTLGLSSKIRGNEWHLVVANPKDAERFRLPINGEEVIK